MIDYAASRQRKKRSKKISLGEHFAKGPAHWNEFILSYNEDVIRFSELPIKGGRFDLDEYEFPLPITFVDCIFTSALHLLNGHFDAWVDLTGAKFKKGVLIEDSVCEGEVIFESVRCNGGFFIDNCEFKGRANFDDLDCYGRFRISECTFYDDASLNEFGAYGGLVIVDTSFLKDATFAGQFQREALFLSNKFGGFVDFNYAHFKAPLVFRGNEFKWRPAIDNIDLTYDPIMPEDTLQFGRGINFSIALRRLSIFGSGIQKAVARIFFIAKTSEQYPTLRQFRLFAKEYDDHRLALDIYALELKSRRLWYDSPSSISFWIGLAYQIFSDFGRSLVRPAMALLGSFIAFGSIFFSIGQDASCSWIRKVDASALISLNNTIPISGLQKQAILSTAEECLFGHGGLSFAYGFFSIGQTVLSIIFVFLLVLAVRNLVKMSQ